MVKGKKVNQRFPCFSRGSRKKGASHFEMIISFIFFLGFVFFLFLFLKPYDTTVLSGSVVAALYDTFEEETHTNLTSLFLKADHQEGVPGECFFILLPGEIFAYAFTNSRVTDLADTFRDSDLDTLGSDANLNIDSDDIYYEVDISPEFGDADLSGCVPFDGGGTPYTLGSNNPRRVVSYSALEEMKERYGGGDYENLKVDLRVPDAFEFFIVSEELDLEMKRLVPDSVNVITYDYVIEVLRNNGTIINARFTLGVW